MKCCEYGPQVHLAERDTASASAAPGVSVVKLFSSSLTLEQNKLERLSLTSFLVHLNISD